MAMATSDLEVYSANCDACGSEQFNTDLHTIKLAGHQRAFKVCSNCYEQSAEDSFKGAAEIVRDVAKLATEKCDPEERLAKIKKLLG